MSKGSNQYDNAVCVRSLVRQTAKREEVTNDQSTVGNLKDHRSEQDNSQTATGVAQTKGLIHGSPSNTKNLETKKGK
jgi:hypothetical protein